MAGGSDCFLFSCKREFSGGTEKRNGSSPDSHRGCKSHSVQRAFRNSLFVFNQKGYCIFCAEMADQNTLDGMVKDMEDSDEKRRRKEEMIKNAGPVETQTPGIYFLDLAQLQKECPEISSKKALLPFFSNTPFLELQLVCAHIPPWLETDASYEKKIRKEVGGLHITVTRKQC